jgi:hypothetical protein
VRIKNASVIGGERGIQGAAGSTVASKVKPQPLWYPMTIHPL